MLHFIQKFSGASSKLLKYPFTVRLRASRIDGLSRKTSFQQNLSPLSPRTWLSTSFQVCMNNIQCYHASPCNFKRQQKEAVVPSRAPSTITYLPDSPKPALYSTLPMGHVFTGNTAFRDQKRVLESLELELQTGSSEPLSV
ncbi:transmembrane protein 69 isoform X2 [Arvicola amphibius]|uniref:transmembrane protein 69 isoform X2 n=1 Tax=Arvicola amphibius TaxID=1047088 RepID=UPI001C0A0590|nr:transmembrane protein 69 isoform X2 [Arvicola amphibius]